MWDWLSKIDPNIVLPALGGIATWLWHKARGESKASASETIHHVLDNLAHELLDRYKSEDLTSYLKTARSYIESRMWPVLAKRGIPKNATTQKLVNRAIESATAWLASEIRSNRK